ncbi:hypothetical protein RDWZM_005102 [Blomia tropicalis]|uniref:CRIB domain-containing protein n=1 Tax=Blomia tropicalis TaxID=40697 RepID=A0A9Q0M8Q2_BLOTA|nr:hypothetical protein RDWZM_005102 [Blomia tropicalis]
MPSIPMLIILWSAISFTTTIKFAQTQSFQPPDANSLSNDINRDLILPEPSYFIVASRIIRPGQVYRVLVTIHRSNMPINVRASLQRNGIELSSAVILCKERIPETLLLRVPSNALPGSYKLWVEGNVNEFLGGNVFYNETKLNFEQRSMTIFISTDKPVYQQGQIVRFRTMPITTDLKAFSDAIDIYMIDPKGIIMRRWLSRQSNLVYGQNWTIRVIAQGQVEEKQFSVEEYYQTRFEVNVSMPAFFTDTDSFIRGSIMANFTSGIPVVGNLTILYTLVLPQGNRIPLQPNNYYDRPAIETTERYFGGYYEFRRPMSEITSQLAKGASVDGAVLTVTAFVGERFLNLIYSGFAKAYIFSSKIKLKFLGPTPQVFKPPMPFKAYAVVSYSDGSPLPRNSFYSDDLEVHCRIHFHRSGMTRTLPHMQISMSLTEFGLWEIKINLRKELNNDMQLLKDVNYIQLEAFFKDGYGVTIKSPELRVYSTYSPSQRLIQISTSTTKPVVGNYVIFHVRANYYVKLFSYLVVSKGIILMAGREEMTYMLKTFSFSVSSEMAPTATIIVYDIVPGGEVVADSLTFSVDGISRNNFTVSLNNRKDKTGDTIEVIVLGQPGTYVALSAIDKDLFGLQPDNQLSYAYVHEKMITFDNVLHLSNASLTHSWYTRNGVLDRFLYLPSPTLGIDANRTFEYSGLVIFTDADVKRRPDSCNRTQGYLSCLDGTCYHHLKQCDGRNDCRDGTDEGNCKSKNQFNIVQFRMSQSNRIQRLYDNSWLWKDINIGPLGYYIFKAPVPNAPVNWIVSSFGMSESRGFGIQQAKILYSSVRPFYMNVEMPPSCVIGEQIGVRVSIFNYLPYEIEVIVILARSFSYKFVHVEPFGVVQSYNPRTSYGQHQHLVMIYPGQTKVVYMPIVAQRTGKIDVTITAQTQVAKDIVTKTLQVEPDGVCQYTHTSLVLDLSQGAYLIKYLETNITDNPEIPYRKERRYVYGSNRAQVTIVGDVVGPSFLSMPMNATAMLRKPFDAAEPNMFNFAVNVYTLLYLRNIGQRNSETEKAAFKYLNIQYQRQMSFQNDDGSFRAFRWHRKPSVWMTAFCARILDLATFQEWENFLYIDPEVIQGAIGWLIRQQLPDGSFIEVTPFSHNRRTNLTSNISLTAHVLISLVKVRNLRGELDSQATTARTKAQKYLERMLHIVKNYEDPYDLAIVTYALTLVESVDAADTGFQSLHKKMREVSGMRYWGREAVSPIKTQVEGNRPFILPRLPSRYDSSNIVATAYGLLVYIKKEALIKKEIVEWLNTQRLYDSGWATTEDTIVAMEALNQYSINDRLRDVTDITVTIEAPTSVNFSHVLHIGEDNISKMQSVDIPNAYGAITVKAQGSGVAIVQLNVEYSVDWKMFQIQPPIRSFDLDVIATYTGRNSSHINFKSCQRWVNTAESMSSGMSVLEVTIPTGYVIQQQELDTLIRSSVITNLKEARFTDRKVNFYFDYLDTSYTCVSFTVQRWYPVANLTRYIPIRVYDYYAPERFNQSLFSTQNLYYLSVCHVCGSYQCPYCPIFSSAPPSLSIHTHIPLLISIILINVYDGEADELFIYIELA